MNTQKIVSSSIETSQYKYAKISGVLYMLIIVVPILSLIFIGSKITVDGNLVETIENIKEMELLFRIDTIISLIMFVGVIILSYALYVVLKPVDKNLALLALFLRVSEAIFGCIAVLCNFIVLLLLKGEIYSKVFEIEQLHSLAGLFLDIYWIATIIIFVFLGAGSIVNFYLFLKSKYIPPALAIWGILAFLLVLIGAFISMLFDNNTYMILGSQAIIFEIVIGFWLFTKGVNVKNPELI